MTEERPEALLQSALEKIIYFEARSEALHHDLQAARSEAERLKVELAQAASRESELRRAVAEAEVQVGRAHRDREELARLNDALRGERAALIDKLVEASRIQRGDVAVDDGFDLAGFIALLRSESMSAREEAKAQGAVTPASSAGVVASSAPVVSELPVTTGTSASVDAAPERAELPRPSGITGHAQRLRAEGRLEVNANDMLALTRDRRELAGRTEETLFGFSIRELAAPEAPARLRAAERLQALGATAAAPALATALHNERSPEVLVALLNAFAQLAGEQGVPVVLPHLNAALPSVRIAALKALLTLDATRGVPHLSAAMKDPDAAVRRRASLLALGLPPDVALRLGEQAIHDTSEEARALGALALGASSGERARSLLLGALRDPSTKVRHAAARALSSLLGEDVSAVAGLPDAMRRREIRRLASLPVKPAPANGSRTGAVVTASGHAAVAHAATAHPATAHTTTAHAATGHAAPAHAATAHAASAHPAIAPVSAKAAAAVFPRSAAAPAANRDAAPAPAAEPLAPAQLVTVAHPQASFAVLPAAAELTREPHWIETLAAQIADEPAPMWLLDDPEQDREVTLVPAVAKHSGAVATRILASTAPNVVVETPVYATVGAGRGSSGPLSPVPSTAPRPTPTVAPASTGPSPKLLASILTGLRRAPRGLTLPDLASTLDAPAPQVNAACSELLRRGDVVRRGIKYFVA